MAAKNCFWCKSTNMHFFQNAFCLDFLSVLQNFYEKTFFLIQNGGLYPDGVFVILKSPYFQQILYNQRKIPEQGYILTKIINWSAS
jgi:hypothetical protein